ncbi:16S rRNA processing protein RimM [Desulfonispora thiosulfatigenes DSM 11270]|uniref:Ribosome maturation factor RimM n=2 Tax=Desulfonispora thiosulfatigenes TaxID=83661 RepID=A0A1W1VL78_DESTI|nr:16S rRNA processing protein RimM [Desulfonispora thiosulfatigenes DSM 11270]
MIKIGQIIATHGIDGKLKIYPLTDNPKRFEDLEYVYLESKAGLDKVHIETINYHKNCLLIKFKEIDDVDKAKNLIKLYLVISEDMLVLLPEDQFFIFQIIGLNVYEDDNFLGRVTDVIETGSNDVYIVKKDKKEILIPALKTVVKKIDLEEKRMLVDLPEGLLD